MDDLLRELAKAADALEAADRHFSAQAEANAALHMSPTVRPNPLASVVATTLASVRQAIARHTEQESA